VDDNGKTFLHSAAENFETAADLKVIEKAIKRGGNVTKIDNEGNTPLVLSLENAQHRSARNKNSKSANCKW
jgi:ankyrin repeat protein